MTDFPERWIYAGAKVFEGRLRHRWLVPRDDADQLLVYANGAAVIGGIYDVTVRREEDHIFMIGKPQWTGERMDDHAKMTQFIVDDMSERSKHAFLRREKREGDKDPLDEAMAPLLKYAKAAAKTTHGKDALAATVLRRLYDAW